MAKKKKKMSKTMQYIRFSQKRSKRWHRSIDSGGDADNYDYQTRTAHMICFICLEKRGTLTSTGKYVCNRCRREHGYS